MSFGTLLVMTAAGLSLLFLVAWQSSRRRGHWGWVDVTWAFGVGIAALAGAALTHASGEGNPARIWLVAGMAALWSLRLGMHLTARLRVLTLAGRDDPRYERMASAARSPGALFFAFFQAQALFALVFALAPLAAMRRPGALDMVDMAGVLLWALCLTLTARADVQLRRFARHGAGPVCDVGLWSISRHPNYLFEWCSWWGYVVIAAADANYGGLAFITPAFELLLLFSATGIAPAEVSSLHRRGSHYLAYRARVARFIPFLPERAARG